MRALEAGLTPEGFPASSRLLSLLRMLRGEAREARAGGGSRSSSLVPSVCPTTRVWSVSLPLKQNPQALICVSRSGQSQRQLLPAVKRDLCLLLWASPGKRSLDNLCSAPPRRVCALPPHPCPGAWRQRLLEPYYHSIHVFMPQIFIDTLLFA